MLYIFKYIVTTTYYEHYYIQNFICTYILQGVYDGINLLCCGGYGTSMGVD